MDDSVSPLATTISSVGKSSMTVAWKAMLKKAIRYSQMENQLKAEKENVDDQSLTDRDNGRQFLKGHQFLRRYVIRICIIV
ncbi:hypothetical protein RUM44_007812 [Polyplax serrata]|uniref:Uncharacterized protein n=1 Tax=Polyplax serrata TaxID=468196 RepID=A0ABR1B8K8_POLSC